MKSGWCMPYFILRVHAHRHAQCERHPLRGAQGPVRLAAEAGRRRRLRAGNQGADRPARRRAFPAVGLSQLLLRRLEERLQRRGASTAGSSRRRSITGYGSREFDAEGRYIEARFKDLSRGFGLPSVGLLERGASAREVPLHGPIHALPAIAQAQAAQLHPVRRLEHRPPADRSAQLALEPEELGISSRGARLARRALRRRALTSTRSARRIRIQTTTPGGPTAGRPGRRTSAGASTTRC